MPVPLIMTQEPVSIASTRSQSNVNDTAKVRLQK
jgi:hypothetical protein